MRRRSNRKRRRGGRIRRCLPSGTIGAAFAIVAGFALAGSAFAYFSAEGAGTAEASVTSLGTPTITTATAAAGGTVSLAWSAVAPPAGGEVTYYVSRNGDEPGGNCPDEPTPTTVRSCTDSSLSPDTYEYTVTAVWSGGFTSTSAPVTVEVTVGPVEKFGISASNTTPIAGEAVNLTITAQDEAGGTVTTYTGSHSFVFSGAAASPAPSNSKPSVSNSSGTATTFGTGTALTFVNGVATVSTTKNGVMRIYKSGEASVVGTSGTLQTEPLNLNVTSAAANKYVLGAASTTPAAAAGDALTITAQDTYSNTATGYTGTKSVVFSGAAESATGVKPTVSSSTGTEVAFGTATPIAFSSGVATASGGSNGVMTIYKSGAASIKATEGSLTNATALAVTVSPLAATSLTLTATAYTLTAGGTVNLVLTAKDTYGNTATTYTGTKNLTFSGAESSPSPSSTPPTVTPSSSTTGTAFGTVTPITFTSGVSAVTSSKNGLMKLSKVGVANVSATDGTFTTPAVAFTVSPGATYKYLVAAASATPAAGAGDALTITAQDASSNPTPAYTGTKSLVFSGATESGSGAKPTVTNSTGTQVAFGTATPIVFSSGVATASGGSNGVMTLPKSGAATIKATEGSITTTGVTVTVSPLAAASLTLTASTYAPTAAGSVNLILTAKDTYGNTATTYTGVKTITFSGAENSPSGTVPTVSAYSTGTATAFGTATQINFTSGASAVSGTANGRMLLYRAGVTNIGATDGTFTAPAVAFTVAPGTGSRVAFYGLTASAGTVSANCALVCTVTGLGNSGTVKANLAITDAYANVVSTVGASKTGAIAVSGTPTGTIAGTPVSFPETGPAISTTQFTYTSPSSGTYSNSIAITSSGYTGVSATVNK